MTTPLTRPPDQVMVCRECGYQWNNVIERLWCVRCCSSNVTTLAELHVKEQK